MKIFFNTLSISIALFLLACSEDKLPSTEEPKIKDDREHNLSNITSKDSFTNVEELQKYNLDAPARKRIMADVNASLEPLNHGFDPILNFKNEWGKFDHPFLSKSLSSKEVADYFNMPQKSIQEQLIDPNEKWNKDERLRRAAVGRCALMLSLTGTEGVEISRFPEIMTDMEKSREVTEGDLLFMKCTTQAMSLIELRPQLLASYMPSWIRIAKSSNPVCRITALIVFATIHTSPAQQSAFYESYITESDLSVGKIYVELIESADPDTAVGMLTQFKSNAPVASQLNSLIDENLIKLRKK